MTFKSNKKQAGELTEDEQDQFAEAFYNLTSLNDLETPCPWGCPWIWDSEYILFGETIEDKAQNFYNENQDEIKQLEK